MSVGARIPVAITFHPPDKRRRDTDGMLSALKSSLDGVADALQVDDSLFDLSLTVREPVKGGEVVVTVGRE
jgi:crossover junction endodeoxyribonuclease RusA